MLLRNSQNKKRNVFFSTSDTSAWLDSIMRSFCDPLLLWQSAVAVHYIDLHYEGVKSQTKVFVILRSHQKKEWLSRSFDFCIKFGRFFFRRIRNEQSSRSCVKYWRRNQQRFIEQFGCLRCQHHWNRQLWLRLICLEFLFLSICIPEVLNRSFHSIQVFSGGWVMFKV